MRLALVVACAVALVGCAKDYSDLENYIAEIKARPGGRIEPLPQIEPYETFVYSASDLRSPFAPAVDDRAETVVDNGIRPDRNRPREFLEQYPLDTLRMVGTLNIGGTRYALIKTADGLINRVRPGNHMGLSEGRGVEISDSEIRLLEIVSDGLGGYIERPAAVALSD